MQHRGKPPQKGALSDETTPSYSFSLRRFIVSVTVAFGCFLTYSSRAKLPVAASLWSFLFLAVLGTACPLFFLSLSARTRRDGVQRIHKLLDQSGMLGENLKVNAPVVQ